MGHEYYDNVLNRDVMEFSYRGDKWRFPKILGERFEVSKLLAVSGFGALLVAKDKWIFNRKVLIKTGFLNKSELCTPNNASLPELVKRINVQYVREQKFLLHGQMRHITGIPTLIDWMYDVSPMIRGPHTAVDGQQIYHDNPNCWQSVFYLVLSYFDGKQLDEYCRDKPKAIINKPTEFFRFLMFYLVDVLLALHRQQPLNA
ncbi:MAG: hypothetical protein KAH38_04395, partial [Candidatus Hydrogenedentes bacterium]|nr:hypothetical protein [Candidatus Hydrogenedentota bacterium]